MRFILLLLIPFSLIFSNNTQIQQAQEYETKGKYKEAMQIYKALALKNKEVENNDEITQKQVRFIKENLTAIEDKETKSTIEQVLTSSFDLYAYKDNYFLPISYDTKQRVGREQNEAKFQFSIKKPLSYDLLGFNETINFGYTQTSWWQIYAQSAPFRESNYQPEIFAVFPYKDAKKTALKGLKVALLHESNGQGGTKSRSWNRVYLESFFQLNELFITPRIWYRLEESPQDDDNTDIEHYLGYGDINFFYAYKDHTFKALVRNNLNLSDNKGYGEVNWTFPFGKSNRTFGYLQLSSGYGDSLIDYNQEVNRISFGISLSR